MGVTPQLLRDQLLAACTLPMDLDGHRINPHAYVGMGTFPDDGQSPRELLMAAARSADVGKKLHLVRPSAHRNATGRGLWHGRSEQRRVGKGFVHRGRFG